MITQNIIDEAMSEIAKKAKVIYEDKLKSVVLFGSCARGDYDSESDIDFVILLNVNKTQISEERNKLDNVIWDLDEKYNYDLLFSPIVKSYEEFEEWSNVIPFYKNIKKEGKENATY